MGVSKPPTMKHKMLQKIKDTVNVSLVAAIPAGTRLDIDPEGRDRLRLVVEYTPDNAGYPQTVTVGWTALDMAMGFNTLKPDRKFDMPPVRVVVSKPHSTVRGMGKIARAMRGLMNETRCTYEDALPFINHQDPFPIWVEHRQNASGAAAYIWPSPVLGCPLGEIKPEKGRTIHDVQFWLDTFNHEIDTRIRQLTNPEFL